MKIVDLNVLLYAVNADAAGHDRALAWWEAAVGGDETIGLPWVVVLGFLRLATNHRVFPTPLGAGEAIAKVDTWLGLDTVRLIHEKPGHWELLKQLLAGAGTAGNLTTDAHLAALAISHDATLVSSDRDLRRFRDLRTEDPLAG